MVTCLNALAHNVLIWARGWLAPTCSGLARIGLLRFVRDLLAISGEATITKLGSVRSIRLNARAPRADELAEAFSAIFKRAGITARVRAA